MRSHGKTEVQEWGRIRLMCQEIGLDELDLVRGPEIFNDLYLPVAEKAVSDIHPDLLRLHQRSGVEHVQAALTRKTVNHREFQVLSYEMNVRRILDEIYDRRTQGEDTHYSYYEQLARALAEYKAAKAFHLIAQ